MNIVLTQSSASLAVTLGQKVTISCRTSESVNKFGINLMHWNQQKLGHLPKILIYNEANPEPGISARLNGDEADLNFTIIINPIEADGVAGVPELLHTEAQCLQCLSPETSQLGLYRRLV